MIDAEDVLLVESAEQNPIEFLRREQIVTERFFNDDSSPTGAACLGELFYDQPEERRRDSEVMSRPACFPERFLDRRECIAVVVIPTYILEQ